VTFTLTNNKGYEVQMLRAHVWQEALTQAENYYDWQWHMCFDVNSEVLVDEDAWINALDDIMKSVLSPPIHFGLTLAIQCHDFAALDDVVCTLGLPGLPGSILRFLESGDTGTSIHSHYLYQSAADPGLLLETCHLALWWSVGLTLPPLDQFHTSEQSRLYCKYDPTEGGRSSFSMVLVETNPDANSPNHCKSLQINSWQGLLLTSAVPGYCVAELKLIFCLAPKKLAHTSPIDSVTALSTLLNKPFAYVHWLSAPSVPNPVLGLREVKKVYWDSGRTHACGIVLLDAIKFPCTLALVLNGFCDGTATQFNSLEKHNHFYINLYASCREFMMWRM
jgi:hypothetical protein